jgi:hypothetical protein
MDNAERVLLCFYVRGCAIEGSAVGRAHRLIVRESVRVEQGSLDESLFGFFSECWMMESRACGRRRQE